MAEDQVGDDDAFLYGEDAEQEEANRGVEAVEAPNGGGDTEDSRQVRCTRQGLRINGTSTKQSFLLYCLYCRLSLTESHL